MSLYNQPQYETYSYEFCRNDAHYGYDCPPQAPFIYNPEPCYNQDFDNNFPQTSPSLPEYLCCTRCGGPHETFQCDQLIFDEPYCENCEGPHMSFQCQPMNQNFYNSNPSGFDQFQPSQYPVSFQPPEEIQKKQEEQAAFTPYWKFPIFDDNDDEYTIQYKEYLENSSNAITPNLSTEEPDNSLRMGDEHLSTILKTELDELIKSSVENLVPIQSESENEFAITLLEEFSGELAHIDLIPPGINKVDFDPEEEIRLVEKLLFDNSSPRPPEEFNSENSNAIIESFSSSHILVEDSGSLMEEIDLFLTPDDSMPPGIENDNMTT
ncbi:hypothetical protein Tco_1517325 [Tanacetum coccineum]